MSDTDSGGGGQRKSHIDIQDRGRKADSESIHENLNLRHKQTNGNNTVRFTDKASTVAERVIRARRAAGVTWVNSHSEG